MESSRHLLRAPDRSHPETTSSYAVRRARWFQDAIGLLRMLVVAA
jgi:hypothetical protein